ncbi:fimbrial biogenesis chaperone [Bradyrhizobium hipponense]|uniref:fimbrial biogenesis chaperone n=1 Tax=Bradyrhizobium hipponense TaxID=2605638 RepID=UPI001652D06D|nr:molecular chaperone [Bradyrhizobium hipponense]
MPTPLTRLCGIAFACLWAAPVEAASLRVAPTTLDLPAPDSAATLNLRNEDNRPINVQMRVFRWTQSGSADRLESTADVVASPPSQTLAPNADYVVRVVRVGKQPVVDEESYRVVIDELPDPARRRPGVVNLALRYSVPVFFRAPDVRQAQVSWTIGRSGNALAVTARNTGQQRLKIADLKVTDGAGQSVPLGKGLVGYVLGNATMQWSFPAHGTNLSGRAVTLSAQSDAGQINATAAVQAGR